MKLPPWPLRTSSLCSVLVLLFLAALGRAATEDRNWDDQFGVPGTDDVVRDLCRSGQNVYVGGRFTQVGGVNAERVAKWDGTNWSPLGAGVGWGLMTVAADDRNVYAGGVFVTAGGQPIANLARWDGTNWWPVGGGVNGIVRAMVTDGGTLYVGGSFTMAGGLAATNIARWDGTNWWALGPGINGDAVDCLLVNGGTLYAGGRFRRVGTLNATNIAQWDGTNWMALGTGLRYADGGSDVDNGKVEALTMRAGRLVAAGAFRLAGHVRANSIAEWTGSAWVTVGDGTGLVFGISGLATIGATLFAGGGFHEISKVPLPNIAQWDETNWSPLGSGIPWGPSGWLVRMAATGDALFVAGSFGTAGGKPSVNIALWHIPHSLEIRRSGECLEISWPSTGTNFVLESTRTLGDGQWVAVPESPVLMGERLVMERALDLGRPAAYFRLRRR